MEKEAPAVVERLPNLIRGRDSVATLLVQFRASMKLAIRRPMEMKQMRRISGQIRLGQSWGTISANCMGGVAEVKLPDQSFIKKL
jgi:hypothetical protein